MALLKLAAKPKNCKQTICGKSCIRSTYTCRIKEPRAKEKIKAKTKALAEVLDKAKTKALAIGAKSKAKTKAQELISQAKTKAKTKALAEALNKKLTKALDKPKAEALAKTKADELAKAKADELAKAKAKELAVTKTKELAKTLAKTKAEALAKTKADELVKTKTKELAKTLAKAKADELAKTKAEALAKAKTKELAKTLAKAKADELAKAKADELAKELAETKFNFNTLIGEGAFGKVFLDKKKKVVQKVLKFGVLTDGEIEISKAMGEAGFSPKVYSEHTNAKKITMDLVKGKTLGSQSVYNLEEARAIFRGISFLQKKLGYAHGDLHQGNIIIDGKNAKIIDFGLTFPHEDSEGYALRDFSRISSSIPMKQLRKEAEFKGIISLVDKYGKMSLGDLSKEENFKQEYRAWLASE